MLCRSFDPESLKGAWTQTRSRCGDEPVTSFVYQRYNVAIPARCYLCVRVERTMKNQGQKYRSVIIKSKGLGKLVVKYDI